MQIVTNSQLIPASEPETECRLDGSNAAKTSKKAGYAERRDLQHALVWDQEPARMTFAEMPSAEEIALCRLFEQARKHTGNAVETVPPPLSAAVSQNVVVQKSDCQKLDFSPHKPFRFSPPPLTALAEPCVDPYADRHELVGLETLAHVPSYEQLLRTTSYNIIESHALSLREAPLIEGKRFDASLKALVDAADFAQSKGRSHASRLPQLRCQAYLSTASRSELPGRQSSFSKLRGLDEHLAACSNWSFWCVDQRDIMQNIWNRFVAKKNASLMLAVMQRKMRIR